MIPGLPVYTVLNASVMLLDTLDEADRIEVFNKLQRHFCFNCGITLDSLNDEICYCDG